MQCASANAQVQKLDDGCVSARVRECTSLCMRDCAVARLRSRVRRRPAELSWHNCAIDANIPPPPLPSHRCASAPLKKRARGECTRALDCTAGTRLHDGHMIARRALDCTAGGDHPVEELRDLPARGAAERALVSKGRETIKRAGNDQKSGGKRYTMHACPVQIRAPCHKLVLTNLLLRL